MTGVFAGAIYLNGLNWVKAWVPQAIQPLLQLLGSGLGLVFILMVLPGGVGSMLFRARDSLLRRVADRRGIVVPSLVADRRVVDDSEAIAAAASPVTEAPLAEVAGVPVAPGEEAVLETVGAGVGAGQEVRRD